MSGSLVCSVVIPAYRCEAYIADCLRSVQTQTITNIEIIVVDDCSPDGMAIIVTDMAKQDSRIRYIKQNTNQGVAAARNLGVQEAQSEWIAFLDSDDIWMPEKLERQFALQRQTRATLIYTGAHLIDVEGRIMKKIHVPLQAESNRLLRGNVISSSAVLCAKEALLHIPMERDDLHEDLICWVRILKTYGTAAGIDLPLHAIRLTPGSRSRNKLRNAYKTWLTYRYLNVPFVKRCAYFACYCWHGFMRYRMTGR